MRARNLAIAGGLALLVALTTLGAAVALGPSPYQPGSVGYDVAAPQCTAVLPNSAGFGIVGVTNGLPWSANPCLAAQYQWAGTRTTQFAFYMDTANPGPVSPHWLQPGPRQCADVTSYTDIGCSYNYGWNAAVDALNTTASAAPRGTAVSRPWWLDVENANSWNGGPTANTAAVQGYLDSLTAAGIATIGIYSTADQWTTITGGYVLSSTPNWLAGAPDQATAAAYCGASFSGAPVWLVQFHVGALNGDYACPSTPPGTPLTLPAVPSPTPTILVAPTVGPTPAGNVAQPAAAQTLPQAVCSPNSAQATFTWTPRAGASVQWLDISLTDNAFAPGTFVSAGPFPSTTAQYVWTGLKAGAAHFWRVNVLTASGWVQAATGAFVPCGGPQLRGTSYTCSDGKAVVSFFWAPSSPAPTTSWLDLSLADNGFAPGTFISAGPFTAAAQQFTWTGIMANAPSYWRYDSLYSSGWLASPTGDFTAAC